MFTLVAKSVPKLTLVEVEAKPEFVVSLLTAPSVHKEVRAVALATPVMTNVKVGSI